MNLGIENNKGVVRQLEIFPCLEDIPEYQEKIKAWEYVNLSDEDRNIFIKTIFPTDSRRYPSPVKASIALNNKAKFPLTEPRISSGVVAVRDTKELYEYCKEILDKDGHLLPSKYQQQAA